VAATEQLFDRDEAFPRLSDNLIAPLDAVGVRRPLTAGEILFNAGDRDSAFYVVLSGRVAIIDAYGTKKERVLGVHEAHRFVGELSLVTGQPTYTTAVVRESGEAIELSREQLQAVVGANQQLGDVLLTAFMARRAILIGGGSGLRLIGSHLSPDCRRLREFLTRNRIPHSFIDLEVHADAELLLQKLSSHPTRRRSSCAGRRSCATRATSPSPRRSTSCRGPRPTSSSTPSSSARARQGSVRRCTRPPRG
jgi:thioredoxin reductase (NADPH)